MNLHSLYHREANCQLENSCQKVILNKYKDSVLIRQGQFNETSSLKHCSKIKPTSRIELRSKLILNLPYSLIEDSSLRIKCKEHLATKRMELAFLHNTLSFDSLRKNYPFIEPNLDHKCMKRESTRCQSSKSLNISTIAFDFN